MKPGSVWLAAFLCCPIAAWPLLAHPACRRFSLPSRIGLAAAAGGALLSTWMTLFALAGVAWSLVVILVTSLATSFLLRFSLPEEGSPVLSVRRALRISESAANALAALAVLAGFFAAASSAGTSPDLLTFWGPKAEAFAGARTLDASFLGDPLLDYMHRSYPPFVTNLYAFATMAAGRFAWGAATLTLPLCLAVLALSLPGVLRTIEAAPAATAASAFVVASFGLLGIELYSAGNADPWLWIYETLAVAVLAGDAGRTNAGQLLAGLFFAGAVTAKVEGLPFAAAAAVLFLYLRRREIAPGRAALFLLLPGSISLGAWFAFGATRRLFSGYEQYGELLTIYWSETGRVLRSVVESLWSAGWALPWILPLIALLAAARKSRLALLPLAVSAVLAAFFVFTYLHQGDASLLVAWSAGRAFSPLVAFLATAALCRRGPDPVSAP